MAIHINRSRVINVAVKLTIPFNMYPSKQKLEQGNVFGKHDQLNGQSFSSNLWLLIASLSHQSAAL